MAASGRMSCVLRAVHTGVHAMHGHVMWCPHGGNSSSNPCMHAPYGMYGIHGAVLQACRKHACRMVLLVLKLLLCFNLKRTAAVRHCMAAKVPVTVFRVGLVVLCFVSVRGLCFEVYASVLTEEGGAST
jgi:hypothetical protein